MKTSKAALIVSIVVAGAATALAQTTPTPPATTPPASNTPTSPPPANTAPSTTVIPSDMTLTEAQANAWIDKVVYSSDGTNVGEVAAFARDSSGKVTELHADVGGLMGMGETRVRITPAQFSFGPDRIILKVTAEEAKRLPQIAK